jgi:hypothetical protein
VRELTDNGQQVVIESQAGAGAGFGDADYKSAGGEIVSDGDAVFGRAELIVKVKEPLAAERKKLFRGQVLFTYLHLAPDRVQTEELMATGVTAIAYETVTSQQGTLPLLMPMSEVAGRMAPHVGAHCLEKREWRTRRAACRRAGRCHRNRRHPRRWCRRNERGQGHLVEERLKVTSVAIIGVATEAILQSERSHEATGIHQAYWRGCSGMAAYGARPGYQEAAVDRQAEFWF